MNPYRSLMGLPLACLLAAAPAAAAELPKHVIDQRVELMAKHVSERMTGITKETVLKKLNGLRTTAPAQFIALYADYQKTVDAYDKGKGNTQAADERDYLLATQVSKVPPGAVAATLAAELITLRKTSVPFLYTAKVAAHEQTLSDYEKQKKVDAGIASLSKQVASRKVGGDAKAIEKELKDLFKNDPIKALSKFNEYKAFIAQHDQLTGKTPAGGAGQGAGVAPEVTEWVKKAKAAVPAMDEAKATKLLSELKTTNPTGFANLTSRGAKTVGDWCTYTGQGTGYPRYLMTKTPASSGGGGANKTPESVDGKPVEDKTDPLDPKNEDRPILKVLEAMLANDPAAVGSAMAARFGDYLVKGDEGKYVSPETRKDEAVLKALAATPQGWVDKMVSGGKGGRVALLYFALGSGGLDMSWAKGDPALQKGLPAEGVLLADLVREMKPWTGEAATGKTVKGPITTGAPETVFAFLEDAADNAKIILDKKGASIDLVLKSIDANEQKDDVYGGSSASSKITGPIKGFDMKELYIEGGKGNENVHQIKEPKGYNGRHIVLKMTTVYEGGKVYNKIGVYDVTNSGDVFGRKFDIAVGGSLTFKLDDRSPGMPDYKLSFETKGGETKIVFGRAGKSEPAHQITTSVSELYKLRAEQAVRDGSRININGADFIVMGQGGAKGGLLFFPGDLQKQLDAGKKDITPSHVAVGLNERLPDGRTLPSAGKPGLWGGKIKGDEYHLEYDDQAQAWKVAKGAGDPINPPVTTTPGGAPGGGSTATTGTGTTGGDPSGGQTTQDPTKTSEMMTTQVVQQMLKGEYEVNKEVQQGLTPAVAETFMVLSVKPGVLKKFAERHYMTAPGAKLVGLPIPKSDDALDKNERQPGEVRGIGKYLAVKSPNGDVSYFDLTDADENRPTIYKPAGSILEGNIKGISDVILLDASHDYDALRSAGFTTAEAKTAVDQLRDAMTRLGSPTKYLIDGEKKTKIGILVAGKRMYFWPKVEEATTTPKDDQTSGKGTAYDASIGGADVEASFPVKEIETTTATGPAKGFLMTPESKKDAALYADDKDSAKAAHWWLVFTYVNSDGSTKQSRPIMVFDTSEKEELATFPGFSKLSISGTTKRPVADVAHFGAISLIKGSETNKAKGVYGAFSNKDAKQVRDKADICLGPVIWWGVSDEEAKEACENGEL